MITFKFGVANNRSLADGLTGANCRGSEHEIIFTWSLNSGKRQILADGKDVHYSETGQNGWTTDQVFQHQFPIRVPGLSAPLRCHLITQPANRDIPSIQPFDIRVNGISYFSMSKIFQLGTPQMISRPVAGGGRNSNAGGGGGAGGQPYSLENDPSMSPDERKAIAAAKLASMKDLERQRAMQQQPSVQSSAPAPPQRQEENLISLLDDPMPAPVPGPSYYASHNNFASSITMDPALANGSYGQQGPPPPQPLQHAYSNYSMGSMSGLPPPAPQSSFASPYASQASLGSSYAPPSQQSLQSFGQLPPATYPPPQPPQYQQQTHYQQQPPQPLAPAPFGMPQQPLPSPSNQTMASYQSYGSAPTFAQPPQQQFQQQPPPPQQQQFYGAPQGYPQY
jgi:hypothetical protein